MRKIVLYGLIVLLIPFSKLHAENWFSEYWQQFFWKAYETDRIGIRSYVLIETGNHWKNTRVIYLSEQFAYKVNPDLDLEIHYSYIHGHPLSIPTWQWQHRIELEANRTFHLPRNSRIVTRNRLEIRWKQNSKPQPDWRFRHRSMFVLPLNTGNALKAYSCYNELFFNISKGYFSQDRICPCQLTFGISDKVDLDLFIMIRLKIENKHLKESVVTGTQLNF